ncbi:MAG: hypothetical protein QXL01_01830, partial [Thermoplasmatales archaeon]
YVNLSMDDHVISWLKSQQFERIAQVNPQSKFAVSLTDSEEEFQLKISSHSIDLLPLQQLYLHVFQNTSGHEPLISIFLESAEVIGAIDQLLDQTRSILGGSSPQLYDRQLAFNIQLQSQPNNDLNSGSSAVRFFVPTLSGLICLHVVGYGKNRKSFEEQGESASEKVSSSLEVSDLGTNSQPSAEFSLVDSPLSWLPKVFIQKNFDKFSLLATACDPTALYTKYISRVLGELAKF